MIQEEQVTEATEQTQTQTQEAPAVSTSSMKQVAEMQAQALTQIVGLHLDRLSAIMVSTNGVSFQRKLQAAKALKEAVNFALDFGLGVTNAKIRQEGAALAKETNELAAVLVKALDNRMLLLANNMLEDQEKQKTETISEKQEGEANV